MARAVQSVPFYRNQSYAKFLIYLPDRKTLLTKGGVKYREAVTSDPSKVNPDDVVAWVGEGGKCSCSNDE